MISRLVVALLLTLPGIGFGQVPGNVTSRVFQVRVPGVGTGTLFALDYKGKIYGVTANHVVKSLGSDGVVELLRANQWIPFQAHILHGADDCDDVAVLIGTSEEVAKETVLGPHPGFTYGQEAYFVGFPYGLGTYAKNLNINVAFMKHAYVSATVSCADLDPNLPKDQNYLLLDGFNNPGFSGGPVVAYEINDRKRTYNVIGVIRGYKPEPEPLNVGGTFRTDAGVMANTGIIVAIPIKRALDLIDAYEHEKK